VAATDQQASTDMRESLLIHGAGGGGWEYDHWTPLFRARGWQPVARDLEPGASGLVATTLADYVQQAAAWPSCRQPSARGRMALVGASMGGAVALQVAQRLAPSAIVLVNAVVPEPWARPTVRSSRPLPDVLRWKGISLESTARALPDSTADVQRWACERWRDESGRVMRELQRGYVAERPRCPTLFVVSMEDRDVPPAQQLAWAAAWNADTLTYRGMSHVGPLLGTAAADVARDVVDWLDAAVDRPAASEENETGRPGSGPSSI
jgi:pimeloyl-ACP methyl ester carboxylesterase